jgi:group I intron endonuclease
MKPRIGVYRFVCKPTGRFYIGSSCDIDQRKRTHLRQLRNGTHHNIYFQRVFNKYGEDSFKFQVRLTDTVDDARDLEQYLLDKNIDKSLCMNIGSQASGGDNLTHNPNRQRIIQSMAETIREQMEQLSTHDKKLRYGLPGSLNGMYGKTHTLEARAKMSKANIGTHHNLGVPKSPEHRAKMSENAKKRIGEKNPFYGKTHTKKVISLLSRVAKERIAAGILPSNTKRVKIGKQVFRSMSFAAKQLGVCTSTVINRCNSDKFPEYRYLD